MKPILCALALFGLMAATFAHEGPCAYCKMPVVQNTKDQDNEVVLKMGNKRIEYRCVFCALKDQGRYKSDLVVYAPSEKVGEPVVLKRAEGKWTAPEGAVFLSAFTKHEDCALLSRAFSNRAAFDAYVEKHKIADAKPLTLVEFLEKVNKPVEKAG